jgi:transketolase
MAAPEGKRGEKMSDLHLLPVPNEVKPDATRSGFGRGLVRAGEANENVVALCADLTGSIKMDGFQKAFPERFIEIGIAEQNLATVGAGLALAGKGHAGLYTGPDGATHQMLEDIALMRVMPGMVVLNPCDAVEAEKMVLAMAKDKRPNYIRLSREATPIITTEKTPFEIGKAYVFTPGSDVTIIATGTMVYPALEAAEKLYKDGIDAEVINAPTIKPLDEETILKSVRKTGCVVTVEEAQIAGGLGGAVAELLGENHPVPLKRIGMHDRYGESGTPEELFEHFGLDAKHIRLAAHHVTELKTR